MPLQDWCASPLQGYTLRQIAPNISVVRHCAGYVVLRTVADTVSCPALARMTCGSNGISGRPCLSFRSTPSPVTCAIFPELTDSRVFQAALDSIELPAIPRQVSPVVQHLFTDGSCLYPRHRDIRLSGGSVVIWRNGEFQTVWQGLVPGAQGVFRAELLAAGTAAGLFGACHIYSDCWAMVRKAQRLLSRWELGLPVELPRSHRDLWEFFWERATSNQVEVQIHWIPSHRNLARLDGDELWKARGNAAADDAAKDTVNRFRGVSADYRSLVEAFFRREEAAARIVRFHHEVALRFVAKTTVVPGDTPQHSEVIWELDDSRFLPPVALDGTPFCPEYVAKLISFFSEVQWSPTGGRGFLQDTSLLELCVCLLVPWVVCHPCWWVVFGNLLALMLRLRLVICASHGFLERGSVYSRTCLVGLRGPSRKSSVL